MRCLIVHQGVLYEWVPHPGEKCKVQCDLDCSGQGDVYELCKTMRDIVGSAITHRFKEVKG
jgi:hypothetical protein